MTLGYLEAVEASAGTGKTFTLAQRVLEEVAAGVPIGRIVVVTFTVAATASLKTRVRGRMRDALRGLRARDAGAAWEAPDAVLGTWVAGAGASARDRIQRAVVDFDEAAISTIHSFCSRLLMSCAFQAGASLSNDEGTAVGEAGQRVVDDLLRRLTTDESALFVRALNEAGLNRHALGQLARKAPELEALPVPEVAVPVGAPPDLSAYDEGLEAARAVIDYYSLFGTFYDNPDLAQRTSKNYLTSFPGGKTRKAINDLVKWLKAPRLLGPFPEFARRFTSAYIADATKVGCTPPTHPAVAPLEELERLHGPLSETLREWATNLRRQLVDEVRAATLAEAHRCDERSFEDLLRLVRDNAHKAELRQAVEARWDLAMLDEFQDTDPVQWAVFRDLFAGLRLLVVGDPKQSIYAFRRADIHSYMDAVSCAATTRTLDTNFRSDERLLAAFEQVFDGPLPFAKDGIDFEPVAAFHTDNRLGDDRAPLSIRHILRQNAPELPLIKRGFLDRWHLEPLCIERVAEDIAQELETYGISPSSCAVLTRKNSQALEIRDALRARGIPSVLRTTDTAFHSPAAGQLVTVLRALIDPGDRSAVSRALVTGLMGCTAQDLVDLKAHPDDWAARMVAMRRWNGTWRDHGVLAALEQWAQEGGVWTQLLSGASGGRTAADLRHLFALLHQAEFEERMAPSALVAWLASGGAGVDEELASQRVESDGDAVQLSTVHKAKGLEYDRVWLPFAWEPTFIGRKDRALPRYYDSARGCWVLDVRTPVPDEAIEAMGTDKLREDLRQAYVALTRAKHRCVVYWGAAGSESGFGYLLHRDRSLATVDDLRDSARSRVRNDSKIREDLDALAMHPGITVTSWDPTNDIPVTRWTDPNPVDVDALEVRARQRGKRLDTWWRRTSFTNLMKGDQGHVKRPGEDRDDVVDADADGVDLPGEPIPTAEVPGGAHVGNTVHDSLERHDFQGSEDALRALVAKFAPGHGVAEEFVAPIASALQSALETPLFDDGFTLADLPWARTLREPDFVMPVRGGYDPGRPMSCQQLAPCFQEPLASRVRSLRFLPTTGFMEGKIDLIFEREGRFYLLDWKSNKVGTTWASYSAAQLDVAMDHAAYKLQAHLYALALHRLLQQRLGAAYDYERHFGEIIYAYVRGMSPETGRDSGIWRHRPQLSTLQKLEATLAGGGTV